MSRRTRVGRGKADTELKELQDKPKTKRGREEKEKEKAASTRASSQDTAAVEKEETTNESEETPMSQDPEPEPEQPKATEEETSTAVAEEAGGTAPPQEEPPAPSAPERVTHSLDGISLEEVVGVPEFFCGRPNRTPAHYVQYRTDIMAKWNEIKPTHLTKKALLASFPQGDVNALGRVHACLERLGVINSENSERNFQALSREDDDDEEFGDDRAGNSIARKAKKAKTAPKDGVLPKEKEEDYLYPGGLLCMMRTPAQQQYMLNTLRSLKTLRQLHTPSEKNENAPTQPQDGIHFDQLSSTVLRRYHRAFNLTVGKNATREELLSAVVRHFKGLRTPHEDQTLSLFVRTANSATLPRK